MDRKSLIAFSVAPIIVSAIGFIFTPVLSWWLVEAEMAKFALFQTNVNFFALFISLGLDQALAREFHETNRPLRLLKSVLQLVFLAIPVGLLALAVIKFKDDGIASSSITPGMAMACVLMLLNRMYASFIRMSGHGMAYAIDIVTPKVVQLAAVGLICTGSSVLLTYDIVVRIFVASSAAALCYEIVMSRRIGRVIEGSSDQPGRSASPRHADLLKFSAPLVPGALAYYAISASAIYIVGVRGDARDVVTTSLAISVGGGLAVLQSMFATLWTPFAYRWHAKDGSPALYKDIATLVTMACAVLLMASMFLAPYLALLFPAKYNGVPRLLILVIVWNLLYLISIVGSFGIGIKRMSFTSMFVSLAGAALSIGLSLVVSRQFGAVGALLSVLTAFLLTLVLNCELSAKSWQRVVGTQHYLMVGTMVAAAVMFSLGFAWLAQSALAISMVFYFPAFRTGFIQSYAILKNSDI